MMNKRSNAKGKTIAVKDFNNEELWLEFKALVVKKKMKIAEALEEAIRMWIDREMGNIQNLPSEGRQ